MSLLRSIEILQFLVIVFFALLAIEWLRLRWHGGVLVLMEFRVNRDGEGDLVYIRGRPSGPVAWALTRLGIESQTTWRVTGDEVTKEKSGLSGFEFTYAPIRDLSSS